MTKVQELEFRRFTPLMCALLLAAHPTGVEIDGSQLRSARTLARRGFVQVHVERVPVPEGRAWRHGGKRTFAELTPAGVEAVERLRKIQSRLYYREVRGTL